MMIRAVPLLLAFFLVGCVQPSEWEQTCVDYIEYEGMMAFYPGQTDEWMHQLTTGETLCLQWFARYGMNVEGVWSDGTILFSANQSAGTLEHFTAPENGTVTVLWENPNDESRALQYKVGEIAPKES